ncbi:hypothetical protein BJX96DRAFT_81524 [Aspergillus floccosus]
MQQALICPHGAQHPSITPSSSSTAQEAQATRAGDRGYVPALLNAGLKPLLHKSLEVHPHILPHIALSTLLTRPPSQPLHDQRAAQLYLRRLKPASPLLALQSACCRNRPLPGLSQNPVGSALLKICPGCSRNPHVCGPEPRFRRRGLRRTHAALRCRHRLARPLCAESLTLAAGSD